MINNRFHLRIQQGAGRLTAPAPDSISVIQTIICWLV